MPVMDAARKRLTAVAVFAAGLAVLVPASLPSAQASPVAPRAARPAGLHVTGSVALPGATSASAFGEAPSGAVYYSAGSAVYAVSGTSAAKLPLPASGRVLAVAANHADLLVAVRRTVTEYTRSTYAMVRQWTLGSAYTPTLAGLYVVGGNVWAWTDHACDTCGLEYANVYRFSTSSATVHRVSTGTAYPGFGAADSTGFYYEAGSGHLVHVTPAGTLHRVADANLGGYLALAGGRVELLALHFGHHAGNFIDSYLESSLGHVYSRRVTGADFDLAGTGAGLLVLASPTKVSRLSTGTGAVLSTVNVPGAAMLLAGPGAAVLTVAGSSYSLVRLAR